MVSDGLFMRAPPRNEATPCRSSLGGERGEIGGRSAPASSGIPENVPGWRDARIVVQRAGWHYEQFPVAGAPWQRGAANIAETITEIFGRGQFITPHMVFAPNPAELICFQQ